MKKIVITGSEGVIGKILRKGLTEYEISAYDLPDYDFTKYNDCLKALEGNEVVIHLAWGKGKHRDVITRPEDLKMVENVYRASFEVGVKRVVMSSSVHADNFYIFKRPGLMKPTEEYFGPDSPYGAQKVKMEQIGKYYSTKGLEVVCLRLRGINSEDKPPEEEVTAGLRYRPRNIWLSHNDLNELIRKVIDSKEVPNNFVVIYAISNNKNRVHDFSNPFGWIPKDSF